MTADKTSHDSGNSLNSGETSQARKEGGQLRRRKLKLLSVFLSALLPGLGHLYLRLFVKGVLLIYLILIDAVSLIYFSSIRMQINVPLLILLILFVPVIYFYSIYDVLQSTDNLNARRAAGGKRPRTEMDHKLDIAKGLGTGLLLVSGGLVLFILRQKPSWLESWLLHYAAYGFAAVLFAIGILLPAMELRRRTKRTGRFTASVLLLSLGFVLILDQSLNRDYMLLYLKWWPAILVMLGVETFVWAALRVKLAGLPAVSRKFRVDLKGLILTCLSVVCVFSVTQQDHYLQLWKKVSLDLAAASADYSEAKGYSVRKEPIVVPVEAGSDKLTVDGINGDITISRGEGFDLEVQSRVYVDEVDLASARKIAEDTNVEVNDGSGGITISVKDVNYGSSGKRHPKVNLFITIPFNRTFILNATTMNGSLLAKNIASEKMTFQTGNGEMTFRNLYGKISAKTLNGNVTIQSVNGDIQADTMSGSLTASDVEGGKLGLSTLVGDIEVANALGDAEVETKNGNITVHHAAKALSAQTQNGLISVDSSTIGGDWNVYSAVGELDIKLPEAADYQLEASSGYGGIETNLPFPVEDKTIKGEKGTGEFQVKLDGNSNVVIHETAVTGNNTSLVPE